LILGISFGHSGSRTHSGSTTRFKCGFLKLFWAMQL
jgi:hypothetical protein